MLMHLSAILNCQKGAFSPFMFGMLAAIGAVSVASQYYARQDLMKSEQERMAREQQQADRLAYGVEMAVMMETAATYNASVTAAGSLAQRVLQASEGLGITASGSNVVISSFGSTVQGSLTNEQVVIAASDDLFMQQEVSAISSVTDVNAMGMRQNSGVAVADTTAVRRRQLDMCRERREMLASAIYNFFATDAVFRMPTLAEYNTLATQYGLNTDFWGCTFLYYRGDEAGYTGPSCTTDCTGVAQVGFRAPWGATYFQTLDLR